MPERLALLMDSEQRHAEGVLYSLANKGIEVVGFSPKKWFPARWSSHLSGCRQSPSLEQGFDKYFEFLQREVRRGVIIPSGDLSVKFLSEYKNQLQDLGFLLNVPPPDVLDKLFNKWHCNQLCQEMGIPVANSILAKDLADAMSKVKEVTWPLIIKPTTLAGGGYAKAYGETELIEAFDKILASVNNEKFRLLQPEIILQEWIQSTMGDNWSCDVFIDAQGSLTDYVTVKRIRTSLNAQGNPTSRLYCGVLIDNKTLLERTCALLLEQGWRGFAHVEYIYSLKYDDYLLTEVNPRLPGYSYLLSSTGHEQAYFYCADLWGEPYCPNGLKENVTYFETLRYPGDITDGIVNYVRGYIKLWDIVKTYIDAMMSSSKVVIEYVNHRDLLMTLSIQLFNVGIFAKKAVIYISRRLPLQRPQTDYAINVRRLTADEFAELAEPWKALLKTADSDPLFMSWSWLYSWWEVWGEALDLELVLYAAFERTGRLVGLAPFYRHEYRSPVGFRVKRLLFMGNGWRIRPTVRTEYSSLIIERGLEEPVGQSLMDAITIIDCHEIIVCDQTEPELNRWQDAFKRTGCHVLMLCRSVDNGVRVKVDGEFGNWLAKLGRNTRLKTYNRRSYLQKNGRLELKFIEKEQANDFFHTLNEFHYKRWGKPCFNDDALYFHQKLIGRLSHDQVALSALEFNGEVISILYDVRAGDNRYNLQSGFFEDFDRKISLGILHFGYAIEASFQDSRITFYDLLAGSGKNTFYKSHFQGELVEFKTIQFVRHPLMRLVYICQAWLPTSIRQLINRFVRF